LHTFGADWVVYGAWVGAIASAELMAVPIYGTVVLSMGLPVVLAAGFAFSPQITGPLAFVAFVDLREFRGEVSFGRALFNRSQVMICAVLASAVFHSFGASARSFPAAILIATLALVADLVANAILVVVPTRLLTKLPLAEATRRIVKRPADEALGYLYLGLLAVPLWIAYSSVGAWGLVAFLAPLFVARQMFAHSRRLEKADGIVESKNYALADSVARVADERRDERLVVAGDLHDEVLQPLYKVHLMGQVLRHDLSSGRLLDLDNDVPELLDATNAAQGAIRDLIHDLRKSTLGSGGLVGTLRLLVRDLAAKTPARIQLDADEVGDAAPTTQLLAYQAAREALNNSVRHSGALEIKVNVRRQDETVAITVQDDGRGFQPELVDRDEHFGLQMLAERVRASGGTVWVESRVGVGTLVTVSLPSGGWRT
jgi:signal transduction histidine kinase